MSFHNVAPLPRLGCTMRIMSEAPPAARTLALGTAENRPAWLRPTAGERKWWITAALAVAVLIQFMLPDQVVLHPAGVAPAVETALVIILVVANPDRYSRRNQQLRIASIGLIFILTVTNEISLVMLIREILSGRVSAGLLLVGGGAIWLTNAIVFALWYWEYDRGGPAARANGIRDQPDLLYPQMTDDHLAQDWEPFFADYLYVSFTNSTAFSPTDTMPLSRWAKLLFAVQAAVSFVTVAMVLARAVNILPGH